MSMLSVSLFDCFSMGFIYFDFLWFSDGFVFVRDLLCVKSLRGRFTEEDVQRVVKENDKQRFQVKVDPESQKLMVKANQGHTVQVRTNYVASFQRRQ